MSQRLVIRMLLIGLPAGLIALGIVAIILYYRPSGSVAGGSAAGTVSGSAHRRTISADDLRSYVRIVSEEFGPRPVEDAAKLARTANWIESTLGPSNMGYVVRNGAFDFDGQKLRNLSAQVRGREIPAELVVVAAHYDTQPRSPGANNNATGVAAALSLANAFPGTSPRRSICFAFWIAQAREAAGCHAAQSGGRAFLAACEARGERVVALLQLNGLGSFSSAPGSQWTAVAGASAPISSATGDFIAFSGEASNAGFINDAAARFSRVSKVPVQSLIFASRTMWSLAADEWPAPEDFRSPGAATASWLPVPGVVPALLVSDTGPCRDPVPPAQDTAARLDFATFTQVVEGLEVVVRELADR